MGENKVLYQDNNKDYILKLIEFLTEKKLTSKYIFDSNSQMHTILVTEDEKDRGKILLSEYFNAEIEHEDDIENVSELITEKSTRFVKSSDKYSDLKSSGFSLLFVAILGMAFLILKALKIINFSFQGVFDIIFYIIFTFVFLGLFVYSISTLLAAKKISKNIKGEEETSQKIINWFNENYTKEAIDNNINIGESDAPPYFKRTEYMKNIILKNNPDLNENFLDAIVEELYSENFDD